MANKTHCIVHTNCHSQKYSHFSIFYDYEIGSKIDLPTIRILAQSWVIAAILKNNKAW